MKTLTSRVLTSLVWVFTNIAAKNAVQFTRNVILWRLLSRREFGLNGMVWIAINGATLLQDLGFQAELIQRKKEIGGAISVTWYANVVIRSVIYVLLYFLSPLVAAHFREPEIQSLLQVASLGIVVGAFGSANEAMLRKNFQFKRLLVVEMVEMVTLTVAQILLAWHGLGVWSLVYGSIFSSLARSICLWWLAPIRLVGFNWRLAKEMLHFGKHMTISTLGLWFIKNMDYYFVGKFMGAAALGVYTLAFKLSELIATNVVRSLASVFYPAFSEVAHDTERLRGGWLRALRYSMLVVTPMGVALMLLSSEVIRSFYPGQEIATVPMTILLLFSLCRGIGTPVGDLAKAINKPSILTRAVEIHALLMGPTLYWITSQWTPPIQLDLMGPLNAVTVSNEWQGLLMGPVFHCAMGFWQPELEWGLIQVSIVVAVTPLFGLAVSLWLTSREVKFTAQQVLGALLPSAVSALFMAVSTLAFKWAWYAALPGTPPLVVLLVLGPFSCILYGLGLILFFPSVAADVRALLGRGRSSKSNARAPA